MLLEKKIDTGTINTVTRRRNIKGTIDLDKHVMIYSGVPQNERAKTGVAILDLLSEK